MSYQLETDAFKNCADGTMEHRDMAQLALHQEAYGKSGDQGATSFLSEPGDQGSTSFLSELWKPIADFFHHDSTYDYPQFSNFPDVQMLNEGAALQTVANQFGKFSHDRALMAQDIDRFIKTHPDMSQTERAALHDIATHFPDGATQAQVKKYAEQVINRSAMIM